MNRKSHRNTALNRLEIRALEAVISDLQRYHRKGIITEGDLSLIEEMVNNLQDKT